MQTNLEQIFFQRILEHSSVKVIKKTAKKMQLNLIKT